MILSGKELDLIDWVTNVVPEFWIEKFWFQSEMKPKVRPKVAAAQDASQWAVLFIVLKWESKTM